MRLVFFRRILLILLFVSVSNIFAAKSGGDFKSKLSDLKGFLQKFKHANESLVASLKKLQAKLASAGGEASEAPEVFRVKLDFYVKEKNNNQFSGRKIDSYPYSRDLLFLYKKSDGSELNPSEWECAAEILIGGGHFGKMVQDSQVYFSIMRLVHLVDCVSKNKIAQNQPKSEIWLSFVQGNGASINVMLQAVQNIYENPSEPKISATKDYNSELLSLEDLKSVFENIRKFLFDNLVQVFSQTSLEQAANTLQAKLASAAVEKPASEAVVAAEHKIGGGIVDGLVQGAIKKDDLKTAEAKTFFEIVYALNEIQRQENKPNGIGADVVFNFADHTDYEAWTDYKKDTEVIGSTDKKYETFISQLSQYSPEALLEIKLLCQDYIQTLENIYNPFLKISDQKGIIAPGLVVADSGSADKDFILQSMGILVSDGYVSPPNNAIVQSGNQGSKNILQGSADYITASLLSGNVTDNEVLEKLLPGLVWRTQGLVTAYAFLSNNYTEKTFFQWATGAILWYAGQLHVGATKKYKYLSVRCLINLILDMKNLTEGFDEKLQSVRLACNQYTFENSGTNPKAEVVGAKTQPYKEASQGFRFEGRTIKRQLITLIWALRGIKVVEDELKEKAKKVVEEKLVVPEVNAEPVVHNVIENVPKDVLIASTPAQDAAQYNGILKDIYMDSCDAAKSDIKSFVVGGRRPGSDVYAILSGVLADFVRAINKVEKATGGDMKAAAIKAESDKWKKPFAYCDGIIKNIFKSQKTLETFVQQTKDPEVITKFIEVVGAFLRFDAAVFDFDSANKEMVKEGYKMETTAGFDCSVVAEAKVYLYKKPTGEVYNLVALTILFVGVVNDIKLFKAGLNVVFSDEIKMGFKGPLLDLCRKALIENLKNGIYQKYFKQGAAAFIDAVKAKIADSEEKGKAKLGIDGEFLKKIKAVVK